MTAARRLDVPDGPLLVVAPHPDDETLGCGGMIARCAARGSIVHTLFVTDGGASHPNSRAWDRDRLRRRREAEAAEALERLRAGDQPRTFLRLPDAAMPKPGDPRHAVARAAVQALLLELRPALVLLPWRRDPHRDHRDSWSLVTDAITAARMAPATLEYAIWLDAFGAPEDRPGADEMVPVSLPVSGALKREALDAHASQLGGLIEDDPDGFALDAATIARLTRDEERYWRACDGT